MYLKPINPGMLEVYCGPMKSGKTSALIHRVDKLNYVPDASFIFIKPSVDTRTKNIISRAGGRSYDCVPVDSNDPYSILSVVSEHHDLVVIDEAQFFSEKIVFVIKKLQDKGKNVIVGGLDLDFRGEPFGSMPVILSFADIVNKLTAVCDYDHCSEIANRTQRLVNGKPAHYNEPTVSIDTANNEEEYQARCYKHHFVPGKPN